MSLKCYKCGLNPLLIKKHSYLLRIIDYWCVAFVFSLSQTSLYSGDLTQRDSHTRRHKISIKKSYNLDVQFEGLQKALILFIILLQVKNHSNYSVSWGSFALQCSLCVTDTGCFTGEKDVKLKLQTYNDTTVLCSFRVAPRNKDKEMIFYSHDTKL